ncbi:MAG: SpoIID/LytB domain-containing protein, partial [Actinobacteria bacterium]|nr:SpoIID/LytB domain-containing protein [Actinomycetota bacterium]
MVVDGAGRKLAAVLAAGLLTVACSTLFLAPAPAGNVPVARGSGVSVVPDTVNVLMPDGSVKTMEMDEYLKGVVPSEVSASWPYDSLAAQAIAARCYASTANRHPDRGANVCTTTHCQVWRAAHDPRTDTAVDSTHKVAARYNGETISAFYFGHCDGHTRNIEDVWGSYVPYCRSVSCPCGFTTMWGHGVGMCQEGARALAAAGWSYRDILKHYYTGVEVESTETTAVDWYFAEGTTRPEFVTYLCLANPNGVNAEVTVNYLVEGGGNQSVPYTIGPNSRLTVDAAKDIGTGKDFSTRVTSTNRVGIVAERPMYFNYKGAWSGGSDTVGAPYPKTTWYFAEGTTRPNFATYFCVGNPDNQEAQVTITYFKGDGNTQQQAVNVSPLSRLTVPVNDVLGTTDDASHDFAARLEVTNGVGIIAERPMYFNYQGGWSGGHDAMGAPSPKTTWYFAEGTTRPNFATFLCIANPSDAEAAVTVTYMVAGGGNRDIAYVAGPHSRRTINVVTDLGGDRDFSCRVASTNDVGIIVERPMYFNYGGAWSGGHDAMGAPYPKASWYFAEGTT